MPVYPRLAPLAQYLISAPASQSFVERLHSSLDFWLKVAVITTKLLTLSRDSDMVTLSLCIVDTILVGLLSTYWLLSCVSFQWFDQFSWLWQYATFCQAKGKFQWLALLYMIVAVTWNLYCEQRCFLFQNRSNKIVSILKIWCWPTSNVYVWMLFTTEIVYT